MPKLRPKYPRPIFSGKAGLSRLLFAAMGLLLLGSAVGVGFFHLQTDSVQTRLDLLAGSLTGKDAASAPANAGTPVPGKPGTPVPGKPGTPVPGKQARTAKSPDPAALPPQRQAAPEAEQPRAESPAAQITKNDRPAGAPPAAKPEPAGASPFAGMNLEKISAALNLTYAGKTPQAWGEHLPGVVSRLPEAAAHPGSPVIALTLDACGGKKGSSYDAELIAFLRKQHIPATIFVTSIWIRNNPESLKELAADPLFEIAAHGTRHKPASVNGRSVYGIKGTASLAELVTEVEGNARDIAAATGKRPRWFRSGTAFYDDVAVRVIHDLGLGIAGFSIAGDQGATLPAGKVEAKTLAAKDGDVLLFHMNHPHSGTREGLKKALPRLLEQGFVFVLLPQ